MFSNREYALEFVSGDKEVVRLNVRDTDGNIIDVSTGTAATLGIKKRITDTEFLIPEKAATMYAYDALTQPYTMEFIFSSDDTTAILNYGNKVRTKLKCVYDVEVTTTALGTDERTTILAGTLDIGRSGRVI